MDSGLLLSLLPLFAWGTSDYFASRASRTLNVYSINFASSVYMLPVPLIICLFKGFPHVGLATWAGYFLSSALISFGFIFMVKGFSKGVVGIVAPIANAYAIVTLLLLVILFQQSIKWALIPAVLMIAFGVALVSYQDRKKRQQEIATSVKYGLLAMITFGGGFAVLAKIGTESTWYGNQLMLGIASFIISIIILLIFGRGENAFQRESMKNKWTIFGGFIGSLGVLGLFAALSTGTNTVLVAAIASASPLVTAYLAYVFDHERLHIQHRIGTFVIVASVVYINLLGR